MRLLEEMYSMVSKALCNCLCLLKINCASFALAALCLDLSRGHRAVHRACILEFSGHVRQHEGNILLSFDG